MKIDSSFVKLRPAQRWKIGDYYRVSKGIYMPIKFHNQLHLGALIGETVGAKAIGYRKKL